MIGKSVIWSSLEQNKNSFEMRFIVCYCCGREFGSASVSIHIPQCLEKFDKEQEKFPASQRKNRPLPPSDWDKIVSGDSAAIKEFKQQYNEAAEKIFDEQRSPCPHCGRKFYPIERLQIHLKSCGPDSFFAKKTAVKKTDDEGYDIKGSLSLEKIASSSKIKKASIPNESSSKAHAPVPSKSTGKNNIHEPRSAKVQITPKAQSPSKPANFCYECGFKFASSAKYCASCGVERISIT